MKEQQTREKIISKIQRAYDFVNENYRYRQLIIQYRRGVFVPMLIVENDIDSAGAEALYDLGYDTLGIFDKAEWDASGLTKDDVNSYLFNDKTFCYLGHKPLLMQ